MELICTRSLEIHNIFVSYSACKYCDLAVISHFISCCRVMKGISAMSAFAICAGNEPYFQALSC